jgi:hypothetical protein
MHQEILLAIQGHFHAIIRARLEELVEEPGTESLSLPEVAFFNHERGESLVSGARDVRRLQLLV